MPRPHHESPYPRTNPNGRKVWVARYTTSDGRRVSAGTFEKKRDAQDAIDRAYEQPQSKGTLGEYLPRWLDEHPVSERTTKTNRGRIEAVLGVPLEGRKLRDWPLHELRRRHAKDLVAHLLTVQKRAPEGVRGILRALSALAEDAITDELADVNPWRGTKVRDDDKRVVKRARQPRVWSFQEMHYLAAHAGRYEPMIRVMADSGARIGEVFALKRSGLNLADGVLGIRGSAWEGGLLPSSPEKNHDRDVPLPAGCLAVLREMPVRIDSEWLFPTPYGCVWRYSNWLRRVWQPACRDAGMDARPNEFRHSWVSHLRAAGIDPADLASVAGHSVETASAHYTHALGRSFDAIRGAIG